MIDYWKKLSGFTIIELLITISIIGLVLTIGLVYYQDFNRRQVVVQAAKDLKSNLRLAQSKALSGEKPGGCSGTLSGYRVDFTANNYTLAAICGDIPFGARTYSFTAGVSKVSGPNSLLFRVLAGGVDPPGEIVLSGKNYSSKVVVKAGGEISLEESVVYVPSATPTPTTPAPTSTPTLPPLTPTPTSTPTPIPTSTPTPPACAGFFQQCNPPPCCSPYQCKTFFFIDLCQ